ARGGPDPLEHREPVALGAGRGPARRRRPVPKGQRATKPGAPAKTRPQPPANPPRQSLHKGKDQKSRMGRPIPLQPNNPYAIALPSRGRSGGGCVASL